MLKHWLIGRLRAFLGLTKPSALDISERKRAGHQSPSNGESLPAGNASVFSPRSPHELLEINSDVLKKIMHLAGYEAARAQSRLFGPIERLTAYVNCLPATRGGHYAGEGGLLRVAIEMAFWSYNEAENQRFCNLRSLNRHQDLEPRWRYVCFIAGLLYPIGKTLSRVSVIASSGEVWPKSEVSLTQWAKENDGSAFMLSWDSKDLESVEDQVGPAHSTSEVVRRILGVNSYTWLNSESHEYVKVIYDVISGSGKKSRVLEVVESAWRKTFARDPTLHRRGADELSVATHYAPYLLVAMRTLVNEGKWVINRDPLIADESGVYLIWPEAGIDLVAHGISSAHRSWPSTPWIVSEILMEAGVITLLGSGTSNEGSGVRRAITMPDDSFEADSRVFKLKYPSAVIKGYLPQVVAKTVAKNELRLRKKTHPMPSAGAFASVNEQYANQSTTYKSSFESDPATVMRPSKEYHWQRPYRLNKSSG